MGILDIGVDNFDCKVSWGIPHTFHWRVPEILDVQQYRTIIKNEEKILAPTRPFISPVIHAKWDEETI